MSKLLQRQGIKPPSVVSTVFSLTLVTVLLLAVPGLGYLDIANFKAKLFFGLTGGFVAIWLLAQLELRFVHPLKSIDGKRTTSLDFSVVCAVAYFLFTVVSAVLSPYSVPPWGTTRYDGVISIGLYVLLFLILQRSNVPWGWILATFGTSTVICCLVGLPQLVGENPFGLYPQGVNYYDSGILYAGRYWSMVGNANLCTAILSLVAGAFFAASVLCRGRKRLLCLIPACFSVFSLFELQAEAGYIALLGGLLIGVPFLCISGALFANFLQGCGCAAITAASAQIIRFYDGGVCFSPGKLPLLFAALGIILISSGIVVKKCGAFSGISTSVLRKKLAIAVLCLVLLGIAALYFFDDWPEGFLAEGHELLHGHWEDSYGSGRLYIWRQTWECIKEAPLFGGGPDTLGMRGLNGFSRYNEAIGKVVTSQIDAAHNEYLNIWVNQGLFSLLPYLALLGFSMLRWWREPKNTDVAIAGMGVLFYALQAFFGISSPTNTPYLWMALSVINKKE